MLISCAVVGLTVTATAISRRRKLLARIHQLEHDPRLTGESSLRPHPYVRIRRTRAARVGHLRAVGLGETLGSAPSVPQDPAKPQCG
jgi:hypothetical protein